MSPRILPSQATYPPIPPQGLQPKPTGDYIRQLVKTMNDDRVAVGDRIERRVTYGPTADIPTARGGGDLFFDETTGDLKIDTGTWEAVQASVPSHTHDDRYYTESEVDTLLAGKSDTGHTHDSRYYTESETDTLLAGKADSVHYHDSRYYTESECNSLFAAASHTHDTRYYTESEVDSMLGNYLPLSAGASKPLTGDLYLTNKDIKLSAGYAVQGYSSTAYYDLIRMNGSDVEVGSTSRGTKLLSSGNVRVMDKLSVEGTGFAFYCFGHIDMQQGSSTASIYMPSGGTLKIDNGSGTDLKFAWVSSGLRILGDTSGDTWVEGSTLKLYRYGYSGSAAPSTSNWPTAGSWGIHVDDGTPYLVYNNGGTIYGVALSTSF